MPTTFYGRNAEDLVLREETGEPLSEETGADLNQEPIIVTGKTAAEEA